MTHKLFPKIYQRGSKRFSNWIKIGRIVNLSCCDCGLVHVIQFRVVAHPRTETAELSFRLRRHVTATRQQRAARKAKGL